ncbi:MAG: PTS sugar transporter subunit IIA [Candidatus Aminicenantales bacterium]
MKLHCLLTEDLIIPDLKSRTRDDVLKEIVGFLKKKNKISRDKELFEKLTQREMLGSTAIGDGVAIPHCKLKGVKCPVFLLGISRKGADFDSMDGKPSHLFFVVITSPDNPSLSLQILAAIAKLVRSAATLPGKVLDAKTPKAIIDIVREGEEKTNA